MAKKQAKKSSKSLKKKTVTKKPAAKKAAPRPTVRTPRKTAPPKATKTAKSTKAASRPASRAVPAPAKAPVRRAALDRPRRRLPEVEIDAFDGIGDDERLLRSARSGHDEVRSRLRAHTESSPALTADDVDASWQDAYAQGDESPGGDNMTPDQDRVDDIGRALGIEYDDDQELLGGGELTERDEHRWELDPGSRDDE